MSICFPLRRVLLACAFLCVVSCRALRADEFRVDGLPGAPAEAAFAQYAGYIPVGAKRLFFWFAEAQQNASSAPVLLWMNGGPGCSSLLGLLTEHGPFRVQSTSPPRLTTNANSWNRVANVIYLETPAGVGFSYSTDHNYTTGDEAITRDNLAFLRGWRKAFPQFAKNPFFIAGESYAGHYVPLLAQSIMESSLVHEMQFEGIAVGNPSTSSVDDSNGYIPFMAEHAFAPQPLFQKAERVCNGTYYKHVSNECDALKKEIDSALLGLNPYNVEAKCVGEKSIGGYCAVAALSAQLAQRTVDDHRSTEPVYLENFRQTYVPCMEYPKEIAYMQLPEVHKALHVSKNALTWSICSTAVKYTEFLPTILPIYEKYAGKLRVLVYSGDLDSCVPYLGTENAIASLSFPVKSAWREWIVDDQVAGYVVAYDRDVTYCTVRDAGHMVPSDTIGQPLRALHMIESFLANKPL